MVNLNVIAFEEAKKDLENPTRYAFAAAQVSRFLQSHLSLHIHTQRSKCTHLWEMISILGLSKLTMMYFLRRLTLMEAWEKGYVPSWDCKSSLSLSFFFAAFSKNWSVTIRECQPQRDLHVYPLKSPHLAILKGSQNDRSVFINVGW